MGQLAMAAQIVGTVLSFTSSMQQANTQEKYAKYQADANEQAAIAQKQIYDAQALGLEREAEQATQIAGQEQAAAQRNAIEERRRARLLNSRALAVAAASGGGASDPTVSNIMGDIGAEGEYSALSALFEGDLSASGYRNLAGARNYEAGLQRQAGDIAKQSGYQQGSLIRSAGNITGAGTRRGAYSSLLSSGSTLYDKYGPRRETWADGTPFRNTGYRI